MTHCLIKRIYKIISVFSCLMIIGYYNPMLERSQAKENPGKMFLSIEGDNADTDSSATHARTSMLLTALSPTRTETGTLSTTGTPTPQPTISRTTTATQRQGAPTRTLRPTNTPPVVPPAADPVRSNWMIALAALAVMVVLIGVWINWRRVS